MKKTAKVAVICVSLFICYIAGYAYFRLSGDIVYFQNKAEISGPEVKAPIDPWMEINSQMANDSDSNFYKIIAFAGRAKPPVLNTVFWPLRRLESACRQ